MTRRVALLLVAYLTSCVANHKPEPRSLSATDHRYTQIAAVALKRRAAHDFGCVEQRIALTNLGAKRWGASGCNERHIYTVDCRSRASQEPAELREQDCDAVLMGPLTQAH
jgi:hypothetical protein